MPAHPATKLLLPVTRVNSGRNYGKTMKHLPRAARPPPRKVVVNALWVSVVVGSILNPINQGSALLSRSDVSWAHVVPNDAVPYCASCYSAAKNEVG